MNHVMNDVMNDVRLEFNKTKSHLINKIKLI
jgi:hypothetical protein